MLGWLEVRSAKSPVVDVALEIVLKDLNSDFGWYDVETHRGLAGCGTCGCGGHGAVLHFEMLKGVS